MGVCSHLAAFSSGTTAVKLTVIGMIIITECTESGEIKSKRQCPYRHHCRGGGSNYDMLHCCYVRRVSATLIIGTSVLIAHYISSELIGKIQSLNGI